MTHTEIQIIYFLVVGGIPVPLQLRTGQHFPVSRSYLWCVQTGLSLKKLQQQLVCKLQGDKKIQPIYVKFQTRLQKWTSEITNERWKPGPFQF